MGENHKYRYVNTSGMIIPSGTVSDTYTTNGTYNKDVTSATEHKVTVNVPATSHTGTYTPAANTSANDMGANHTYRYVNTSGMIKPSGTVSNTYTSNGTYSRDVTSAASHSVTVNVPNTKEFNTDIFNSASYRFSSNLKLVLAASGWKSATGQNWFALSVDPIYDSNYFGAKTSAHRIPINRSFTGLVIASVMAGQDTTNAQNTFMVFQTTSSAEPSSTGDDGFICGVTQATTDPGWCTGNVGYRGWCVIENYFISGKYLVGRQYNKTERQTVRKLLVFAYV